MSANLLGAFTQAVVDASQREIDGKVLTRPTLLVSDGLSLTYGCDIDIGQKALDDAGNEVVSPLRNVPIANGVQELLYADVGAAVRLRRSDSGRWEITGYTKRAPGTYTRVPVTVPTPGIAPVPYVLGSVVSIGISARMLTYEELAEFGAYGSIPYGAIGLFRDDTLLEIR